jgi:ferredoxin
MTVAAKALAGVAGVEGTLPVANELCRRQLSQFEAAAKSGDDLWVGCTQEAPLFTEVHAQSGASGRLAFFNIRENAGWSEQGAESGPKQAALVASALVPDPAPAQTVAYQSGGALLIVGPLGAAVAWAERLAEQLDVAVLATDHRGELPPTRRYPVWAGRDVELAGYLGAFSVRWRQGNPIDLELCTRCNACMRACPEQAIDFSYQVDLDKCKAHRACVKACGDIGAIDFAREDAPRSESFDLVLDLSAEPLMRAAQPPQGYFAPGSDPLAQALAAREAAALVGEFEKPKFFAYNEKICAHGRSGITGCTQCLDVCSTGAIRGEGNKVVVEPHLCMGCGGCATVCPSGAMAYAYPHVADSGARLKAMLSAYHAAGGKDACVLIHDGGEGKSLVAQLGRGGKGLPARVIPFEVLHVASIGLDVMLGALALGAVQVAVLTPPAVDAGYRTALARQMASGGEILAALGFGGGHLILLDAGERKALEQALWTMAPARGLPPASFNLGNEKRRTLDFVFAHLLRHAPAPAEVLGLSPGAAYGQVVVDKDKCTLCMACIGACPEGALLDAKDKPQLRFIERNCVQCGLCEKTCPEDAIRLVPRLNLAADALREMTLHEDQPFQCVRCGKPYATHRMIENMTGRLKAHSMFADPKALARLRMCGDCRVVDMFSDTKQSTISDFPKG